MDTFEAIEKFADKYEVKPEYTMYSITSGAAKSTYYFPVICSKTVESKTATMIAKSLEHSYMSFLKSCFALTPAVVVKGDVVNVEEYLKKFHQNIGIKDSDHVNLTVSLREASEEFSLFANDTLNDAYSQKDINNVLSESSNKNDEAEKYNPHYIKLKDTDVKKANSLIPSVVKVDITFLIKGQKVNVEVPVGVKTILHSIDSDDLSKNIMNSLDNKGIVHNLIKYTTGEVMSLKDLIFGISKIKNRVSSNNKSDSAAKWFSAIEQRKIMNKFKAGFNRRPFLPNLTINISMEDVDNIKRLIGYNLLTDTARTAKFIKDNFLLALVITDDATETAYIMYDGHSEWEEYPYNAIKRENEKVNDEVNALIKGLGVGMKMN